MGFLRPRFSVILAVSDKPEPNIGAEFARAMRDIYVRAKSEAGCDATYFLQMLSSEGPMQTARRLVMSTQPSEGFTALWERGRLDLTVEAHIIQDRFAPLFSDVELQVAHERLTQYGYRPDSE